MEKKKAIATFWIVLAASVVAGFFGVSAAHAATLSFSPQSGTYFTGRSFSVSVVVSSPNQAMNAVQGEISFPTDKLEVLSVSQTNSVVNLWVQNPTFSNQDGTINFAGVVTNPGFQGSAGIVITIQFAAQTAGNAPLSFLSGSILANDGKGTEILSGMGTANFTILPLASAPGSTSAGTPAIVINSIPPIITGKWYNLNQITFNWSVPSSAEGVDYAISPNPHDQLPDLNRGMVSQATYDLSQLSDGPWYFFVSFNSGSAWTAPAVMEFLLDRTPPLPFVITRVDANQEDVRPIFAWAATDQASGIDHYEIKIGNGDWFDASTIQNGSSSYMLPPQSPTASRTLTVRAFDMAGNYTDASTNFTVLAPPLLCSGNSFSCAISLFFAKWGVWMSMSFIILIVILYGFLYYLLRWRRQSRKDLEKFKDELQKDLQRVEEGVKHVAASDDGTVPRPSYFMEEKKSLEDQLAHITQEVKEELEHLKDHK